MDELRSVKRQYQTYDLIMTDRLDFYYSTHCLLFETYNAWVIHKIFVFYYY